MYSNSFEIDRTNVVNPIIKNFLAIKDEYPDCVILFRMGTFFETLFEDAKILSSISGATLTSKNFANFGETPFCGFPHSQKSVYLKQLLGNGLKVCECEEHKNENGDAIRNVKRIHTQGTIVENEFLEITENNYIAAIYEDKNCTKFSYADVSTGQFYKTSGSFEEIKLEAEKIEPDELLILKKQENIFKEITKKYNTTLLCDDYENLACEEIIEKYCQKTQKKYCAKLSEINEYNTKNFLIMDEVTRKNLELTRTKMFSKRKGSLLWFLKYTKTPMGTRLLKRYLSEPLLNIKKIEQRQNVIEKFINNQDVLQKLEETLEDFCDLSRICAKISNSTIPPRELHRISSNSTTLERLNKLSKKIKTEEFNLDDKKLAFIFELTAEIKKAIKEDAPDEITKGGIIKRNYNSELDYLKDKLENVETELLKYETKQKNKLEVYNLKIKYSKVIGYYIELPNSKTQKAPTEYYRKQVLANCTRYATEKLSTLEQEIFNLTYKINELEHKLYIDIKEKAKNFIEIIRELALEIAKIDILVALSRCAIDNNFTKPKFNKTKIKIINGYHPSLIKLKNEIIKNDTDIPNGTMMILTGANMSGKSTYLKYNAIICLLAQIGSYIPADYANLVLIDKLFLRQGATDDIISNNSSFMVEMNDLKFILDNVSDSSLVLLDEPAKSTNEKEGGAISRAFCEYLIENYAPKTIIATHNIELTKLEEKYPKIAFNYVMGDSDNEIYATKNRKIQKGIAKTSLAINTAMLANLPEEIIENAKKYAT